MLGAEEVKLIVALLFLHQLCQKLAPIPSHKLSCEFYHVQVKGGDGGRVCDELKFRRGLFGHNGLLNHLGLHLLGQLLLCGLLLLLHDLRDGG